MTSNQSVTVTATYGGRTGTRSVTIVDAAAVLTSVTVSGPSSVNEGGTGTYTATGTWDNGTTAAISPTWSENSSYATISSGGVLTASAVTSNQSVTVTATYGGRTGTRTVTIVDVPGTAPAAAEEYRDHGSDFIGNHVWCGASPGIRSQPTRMARSSKRGAPSATRCTGPTTRRSSAGSLRVLASSITADLVDFDPLAYPMVKNQVIYLTAQAILDTGDQSSLAASIEWVVSNTGPAPPVGGIIKKK